MSKDKFEAYALEGTAYWSNVFKANALSQKYQIDLVLDDKKLMKELIKKGITFKKDKKGEREDFVTIKSARKPKVLDKDKNIMTGNIAIGNGSKVKVAANIYRKTVGNKEYIGLGLNGLQVLELVEYSTTGDEFLDMFKPDKTDVELVAQEPPVGTEFDDVDMFDVVN